MYSFCCEKMRSDNKLSGEAKKKKENEKAEKYGYCKWEKIPKEDKNGTNCPEYIIGAIVASLF